MRKLFVAAALLLATGGAFAGHPLTHELHAGLAVSRLRGHADTSGKAGFTAGWKMQYAFKGVPGLYVNGGIDATQKGYRANGNRTNMFYAVVPLHVGYRYDFSRTWAAFGEFGPYFGAGLGGKERGGEQNKKVFASSGYDVKRFDWGMGFRLGAEYRHRYSVGMGFDWGCYDLSPKGIGNKNFTFSLALGVRL